uniref:Peptidase M20 dimerisation domain-containing protein n=2 Tax=Hemiselmis andersenii TaxID=464988 RepID=A0A7S1EJH8_HEMAN
MAVLLALCSTLAAAEEAKGKVDLESLGLSAEAIAEEAKSMKEWIVSYRRQLHQNPELMYELSSTSAIIRAALDEIGVPYKYPIAKEGLVGTIGTGQSPVVALRSDMDALPVLEPLSDDTKDFASKNPGKMHACGHDGHMSMLLGAAKLLKQKEKLIKGTVRIVFQPAEEGGAGGFMMVQEGVLSNPSVERMFGIHLWPWLKTGEIGAKAGPLLAAAGQFELKVIGKGGHAAAGIGVGVIDPIVAATAIVQQLQTVISRNLSPVEEGIVSVTMIHAGSAFNVIPDSVLVAGTIRAFHRDVYVKIEGRVKAIVESIAAAHECRVESVYTTFDDKCLEAEGLPQGFPSGCTYPPTVNDADAWSSVKSMAQGYLGKEKVHEVKGTMGGEDFAYFAEKVPSAFVLLGIGNDEKNTTAGLHSPMFKIDEEALPVGAALHVNMALGALGDLGGLASAKPEL